MNADDKEKWLERLLWLSAGFFLGMSFIGFTMY